MPGDSSEIRVDLRLSLDKLSQDAAKAGQKINSTLASSVKGLAPTSMEKEQRSQDERERRRRQNRLTEQRYEWAHQREEEARAARQRATDQSVIEATRSNRARQLWRHRAREQAQDQASFQRNIMFGLLPVLNPGSALGNFASLRQNFKAFSTTRTGASALSSLGLPGGSMGAGMAAVGITTGAVAAGIALMALSKAAHETVAAFGHAAQLYSRVIQSGGMGSRYVIGQSLASRVMGGGDPFSSGAPGALAMQMTQRAAASLNETMPQLTMTTWKFRAVLIDLEASFAKIAIIVAPAASKIADFASALILIGEALVKLKFDGFIKDLEKMVSIMGAMHILSPQQTAAIVGQLVRFGSSGSSAPKVPNVPAQMERIPPSTFERMGLVVGMGGREDYNKKTAENTRRIAILMERLTNKDMPFQSPNGVPSSSYSIPRGGTPVFSPAFNSP